MKEVIPKLTMNCLQETLFTWRKFFVFNGHKTENIITILFLSVFLALTACACTMTGKVLPAANYLQFAGGTSGHHRIQFKKGIATLEYDWHINSENNILALDGSYEILTGEWELMKKFPTKSVRLMIEAYFLNSAYEIVKVERIFFPIDEDTDIDKEKRFERTFPFNRDYKYITFKLWYKGYY